MVGLSIDIALKVNGGRVSHALLLLPILLRHLLLLRTTGVLLHEVVVHDSPAFVRQVSSVLRADRPLAMRRVLAGASDVGDNGASLLASAVALTGLHHVDGHMACVVQQDLGVQVVGRCIVVRSLL
jgi:hypothetical protein